MEAIEFFKVEQNSLTNDYMVSSDCEQLGHLCYAFEHKAEAIKCTAELNAKANEDYQKHKHIMQPLTWRRKPTV